MEDFKSSSNQSSYSSIAESNKPNVKLEVHLSPQLNFEEFMYSFKWNVIFSQGDKKV